MKKNMLMKMRTRTRMRMWFFGDWVAVVLLVLEIKVQGQQSYVNNKQLDCYNHYNVTDGNVCNGVASSCPSYLTFSSLPPYNSPTSIAYLLGSSPTEIASANNVTDVDPIPTGTQILVPVNCSCSSSYYQHNASYVLKTSSDTYFGVANNTYQGLTTCQSLMSQNPFDDRNLTTGVTLRVPLRCACPTANQTAAGVKFLLAYLVQWGDEPSIIAQRFGIDSSTLLQANRLASNDIIYPFTPILVPLTAQPSPSLLQLSLPPPPSPPADSPAAPPGNSNNNKWIFVGVGVGAACLLLLLLLVVAFLLLRRQRGRRYPSSSNWKVQQVSSGARGGKSSDSDYLNMNMPTSSSDTKSWSSTAVSGLHYAVDALTVYKLEQLQRATQFFSEANRIQGSVFRGSFDGDEAAIKVIKGDVSLSGDEINLLKRINHSNIIRLSGFCVHQAHTYLVYEYAPSGSLADCLHTPTDHHHSLLSWKQRVQIAHDVADALNYLHNFTHPPYIHKNLKSSNILLDANLRAKVSNFGLARALQVFDNNNQDSSSQEQGGGFQLTRHVVGTHGYMAPEYIQNGVITPKLDVFAFGVVLLELLSGREAATTNHIDKNTTNGGSLRSSGGDHQESLLSASISGVLEGDHVRDKFQGFMDPSLKREYPLDVAFSMAQVAKMCVAPQINSRPSMAEVFNTLSKILSSTLDWDPSDDAHQLQHSSSSTSLSGGR